MSISFSPEISSIPYRLAQRQAGNPSDSVGVVSRAITDVDRAIGSEQGTTLLSVVGQAGSNLSTVGILSALKRFLEDIFSGEIQRQKRNTQANADTHRLALAAR